MISPLTLASAGLATVLGTWGVYMSTIPRGRVPVKPTGSILLQALGMLSAIVAMAWVLRSGHNAQWTVLALALPAISMSAFFFWLLSQRKTPIGKLQVSVGDSLIAFSTQDSDGKTFHTDELQGKRTLLKFFRGGW